MSVFVDTSAIYAVLDRDDANHEVARKRWTTLLSGAEQLVTSNTILVETAALLQSRLGLDSVRVLFDDIVPALVVEWVGAADHQAAVTTLLSVGRRKLSFVDCCSFQMMHRLELRSAFAFDRHFKEQGFSAAH